MSSEEASQQGMAPATKAIIGAVCLAAIIGVLFWIFKGTTTTTKTGGSNYADSSALSCTANNIDNGVFSTYGADYAAYDLSIIFHDDALYNMTYTLNAKYSSEQAAVNAEAGMHSDFNLSLAETNSDGKFSSSNWSVSGNEVNIAIFATSDEIDINTADELMLDVEDKDTSSPKIPTALKEIKNNYTKRGFVCKEQD